jgi:outer membrane receptor protein involved in Fe transport
MGMKTRAHLAIVFFAAIATSSPTWAQTQAPSAEPAALDEIVVTAEKREESINNVPMAVSAFSGSQLVALGIKNVQDLTEVVPGLTFAQTNFSTPVYTLRGVGFYETSLSAYPDVTVYVDEAALPFPILTTHVGFDLDRVEVLRGPQGILFGQNSTGGAINYVAAKPTSTFQAGTYVSYGEFNAFDLQGYVSGPINDTLSARLAVDLQQGGAYQYSYTRN